MKKINLLILILFPILGFSQNNFLYEYQKADSLLQKNEIEPAFVKFKELEKSLSKKDTLYDYALWYKVMSATYLEEINRFQENFDKSLKFGLEALEGIKKGINI